MEKLFFASSFLFLFLPFYMLSQSGFSAGYERGYKEGYCYEDFGCIPPIAPIAPIAKIGYDSYQDGYNKGFIDGRSAKSGNSTSKSSQYSDAVYVRRNRTGFNWGKAGQEMNNAINEGLKQREAAARAAGWSSAYEMDKARREYKLKMRAQKKAQKERNKLDKKNKKIEKKFEKKYKKRGKFHPADCNKDGIISYDEMTKGCLGYRNR